MQLTQRHLPGCPRTAPACAPGRGTVSKGASALTFLAALLLLAMLAAASALSSPSTVWYT